MSRRPPGTGLHNWRLAPYSAWSFHHVRELIPTAGIACAAAPAEAFPASSGELDPLSLEGPDGPTDLQGLLEKSHTDAFLVLAGGRIVFEWRAAHMDVRQPHLLFSVSKSVTALLSGILTDRGLFDPDAPVAEYLPDAARGAYRDCTMRHVLDMTVAMDFEENYTDPRGEFIKYREASAWNPVDQRGPGPDLEAFLMSIRPGSEPHGTAFRYRSPNSDVLGLVLERAAGEPLAALFSKYLWQPLGAPGEAYITVDRSGLARGAGGLCVTLHDLARVGQLIVDGGEVRGRRLVSAAWINDTLRNGDRAAWQSGDFSGLFPEGKYRNQWYQTGYADGSVCAIGIHGQYLYVSPRRSVVIAKLSSMPDPLNDPVEQAVLAAFVRITAAL